MQMLKSLSYEGLFWSWAGLIPFYCIFSGAKSLRQKKLIVSLDLCDLFIIKEALRTDLQKMERSNNPSLNSKLPSFNLWLSDFIFFTNISQ